MPSRSRLEAAAASGAHVWVVGPSREARVALLKHLVDALPQVTRARVGFVDPASSARDPRTFTEALRAMRKQGVRTAVVVEPPAEVYPPLFSLTELGVQVLSSLPGDDPQAAFGGFLDHVVGVFGLPRHLVLRTFDGTHHVVAHASATPAETLRVEGVWRAWGTGGALRLEPS